MIHHIKVLNFRVHVFQSSYEMEMQDYRSVVH